jgi:hypothetical protein
MTDRVAEFLLSDMGGVTLSVRPPLPFVPDAVRVRGGQVELYGETKRVLFAADAEVISALGQAAGLLLIEHPSTGPDTPRELELQLLD